MERNEKGKCDRCGSDMWMDDDLHWSWCTRGSCCNAMDQDSLVMWEYDATLRYKQYIEELDEG